MKEKRINDEIRADEVSVISGNGESLGIMPLRDALHRAEEETLDLVEVGVQDGVTLTKIMDYGKFLFKQQKTQSKNRSHSKQADIKTLRISYTISDHDLDVRRNQAVKFAEAGHPLRIIMRLHGRENRYEEVALGRLRDFITSLAEVYKSDGKISKAGTVYNVIIYPK